MRFLYVTREELACNCGCGQDTFDVELSWVLEDVRNYFNARLFISSGNRCREYNEDVQKRSNPDYVPYSSNSMHLYSKAADIRVEGVPAKEVYLYLSAEYSDKYGIGSYNTFTHIDVRRTKARW